MARKCKKLLWSEPEDSEKYTVAVAQSIHSIIRINDALVAKFLNKIVEKHDDAPELFLEIIRRNAIPAKFADFRNTVINPAVKLKSKVDYKGYYSSKSDAERWIRNAQKFLDAAKECLNC
ncbi:Uncharacterised protein [uncultured archaeon]|nr:Uncharacterised protein [uncultured archaeon]